jgi:hypothetical protein
MSGNTRSTPGRSACGKPNAEVDRKPGAIMRRTVPIEAEVQAYFADAAKRQEDQLVSHVHPAAAKKTVAGRERLAAAIGGREHQPPRLVERFEAPLNRTIREVDRIGWPRPAARCNHA